MGEELFLARFQPFDEKGEVSAAYGLKGFGDVFFHDHGPGIPFGSENGMFQEVDADPEVPALHREGDDLVEDGRGDYARIETCADTVLQDGVHLLFSVVGEGDLHGVPDGVDRRVEDGEGTVCVVTDGGDDTDLHAGIILVHSYKGADHHVELARPAEVIGVVQADDEDGLPSGEFGCNGPGEPLDGDAGERGLLAKEMLEYGCKDPEGGTDSPAVDEDGDHTGGGLFQFAEDPPDTGGLPGPRRAAEVGVDGACPLQGGAEGSRELAELAVTIVDVVWCVVELKDLMVADECLVVHKIVLRHVEGSEWGVILVERVWGENEGMVLVEVDVLVWIWQESVFGFYGMKAQG